MSFIYYSGTFLMMVFGTLARKKYSRAASGILDLFVYCALTGLIAMAFFTVSSRFHISISPATAVYALVFGVAALASNIANLTALRHMGIAESGVAVNAMSLIFTCTVGFVFFGDRLTIIAVLRCLIMLAATAVMLLPSKNRLHGGEKSADGSSRTDKGKNALTAVPVTAKGILICLVAALSSMLATVVTKLFSADVRVTNSDSLFFLTNLFIFAVCAFSAFFTLPVRKRSEATARCAENGASSSITPSKKASFITSAKELFGISPMQLGMIALNTVSANIQSLLSVLILANGSISFYTPVSGALAILASTLAAVLLFRERPKVLPVLLSISALLLGTVG